MEHDIVYFNNAASSWPKPPEVVDAVVSSFELPYFEAGRSTIEGLHDYPEIARETLCSFFGAESPDQVVFTQNATDSLNILIHGFCLRNKEKFHVITSDLEHNSVLRPLKTLEARGRIRLTVVPSDRGYVSPDSVESALMRDTRLAVLSHGSNVLGTEQDLRETGKCLRDYGVMFVADGAQTAGLAPIGFDRTAVDAFVFTGHKYLFGFPGIGGFLLKDPDRVDPFRQGGTGVDSGNLFHPGEPPLKYEAGTHNYPGIVSLCAGTRYVIRRGISRIRAETLAMTRFILDELAGVESIAVDNPSPDLPVISFNIDPLECDDVGFILLKNYRIITRTGLHCAPLVHERLNGGQGSVRISLSSLNTMEECRYVADALREVARGADR